MGTTPAEPEPVRPARFPSRPAPAPSVRRSRRPLASSVESLLRDLSGERDLGAGSSESRIQRAPFPPAIAARAPSSRIQRAAGTALPDRLRAGAESLSGVSLADVRVHYNSSTPAAMDALAYAQGTDIHLAPGQEAHLPHEAWHVVQQVQGRVRPTGSLPDGAGLNDDRGLEREADRMGARALQSRRPTAVVPGAAVGGGAERETLQLVRREIKGPTVDPITLVAVQTAVTEHLAQADEVTAAEREAVWDADGQDVANLARWRGLLNQRLTALQALAPAPTPQADVTNQVGATAIAYRNVLITLGLIRKLLNERHDAYSASTTVYVESDEYKTKNSDEARAAEAQARLREQKKASAATRQKGLGKRWGGYNKNLKRKNQTTFVQYIPADAATIEKCLRSQNICDAQYNPMKAFWLADPVQFKLGSAAGKSRMEYIFSAEGARSLMEDYLICGSGDFAADNQEAWEGETMHPYFTIWKTNELGAYGVGSARLAELSSQVDRIRAYDPDGNEIRLQ